MVVTSVRSVELAASRFTGVQAIYTDADIEVDYGRARHVGYNSIHRVSCFTVRHHVSRG